MAGTYSATVQGTVFVCSQANAPAECGSPGSTGVPISILHIGVFTLDAAGNGCATLTGTYHHSPVDASPTAVNVFHSVSKITNYNPRTGTGDKSFTDYTGGQCHGATFDSTGATVGDHGTERIAVSSRGKRIDTVVTSDTDAPVNDIGGISLSATLLRD